MSDEAVRQTGSCSTKIQKQLCMALPLYPLAYRVSKRMGSIGLLPALQAMDRSWKQQKNTNADLWELLAGPAHAYESDALNHHPESLSGRPALTQPHEPDLCSGSHSPLHKLHKTEESEEGLLRIDDEKHSGRRESAQRRSHSR